MAHVTKIILINFGIAIVLGLLMAGTRTDDILVYLGLTFLGFSLLTLVIGLFLLINPDKRYAQGFLMSAGLFLLVGLATCSSIGK